MATQRWLRENGFREEDYVYEPGQFAVRGSILDIYAYNNELPYRFDFFGDEIDSIREFNVETQLSERRLTEVSVTANVAGGGAGGGMSLLGYMAEDSLIAVRNPSWLAERVRAIAAETPAESALIAEEGEADALAHVVDADRFCADFARFGRIELSAAAEVAAADATIGFSCSPQGIYHKNFDLIADSFKHFSDEGYKLCRSEERRVGKECGS